MVTDGRNDAQDKARDGTRGEHDRPLPHGCARELVVYPEVEQRRGEPERNRPHGVRALVGDDDDRIGGWEPHDDSQEPGRASGCWRKCRARGDYHEPQIMPLFRVDAGATHQLP